MRCVLVQADTALLIAARDVHVLLFEQLHHHLEGERRVRLTALTSDSLSNALRSSEPSGLRTSTHDAEWSARCCTAAQAPVLRAQAHGELACQRSRGLRRGTAPTPRRRTRAWPRNSRGRARRARCDARVRRAACPTRWTHEVTLLSTDGRRVVTREGCTAFHTAGRLQAQCTQRTVSPVRLRE